MVDAQGIVRVLPRAPGYHRSRSRLVALDTATIAELPGSIVR